MSNFGLSQLNLSGQLSLAMAVSQRQLNVAQLEVSTGRHADMGLSLGTTVGNDLQWRTELSGLQQIQDGNKLAGERATLTQDSLKSLGDLAANFLSTLTGARGAADGQALAKEAAQTAYAQFVSIANTTFNGQYLFGGINSSEPPLQDYAGSSAEAAVNAAFQSNFGFAAGDAAATGITPAAIQGFVDGGFAAEFQPAAWQANWSQASASVPATRIDAAQTVDASSSAAAEPFRQMAQALSMVASLASGNLSQSTFQALADKALAMSGTAQAGFAAEQSRLGLAQSAISEASDRLDRRTTALTGHIQSVESVDKYEAANRANTLMTQLETSYTLTGRISQLSLVKYL